jgi:hypothetical protein
MTAPAGLVKVARLTPLEAVRFDGSRAHAEAIIEWIREAHDYEVPAGHYQSATVYQPVRSGDVLAASEGWWIVRLRRLDFVAYAPAAFPTIFEVVP